MGHPEWMAAATATAYARTPGNELITSLCRVEARRYVVTLSPLQPTVVGGIQPNQPEQEEA
jgi:hypothetical protein